jgi:hypothetical protein
MRGLKFLRSLESREILANGGQGKLIPTLLRMPDIAAERQMTAQAIVALAEKAGAGSAVRMGEGCKIQARAPAALTLAEPRTATDIPLEYLSNFSRGRLPRHLATFRDADLAGRWLLLEGTGLRRLVIWQLHEVATLANQDPRAALRYAELALEMVKKLAEIDLLSWGHSELGKVLRLLNGAGARGHLDKGVELADSPYQQANVLHQRALFDAANGMRGLQFLKSDESQEILGNGGQGEHVPTLLRMDDVAAERQTTAQTIVAWRNPSPWRSSRPGSPRSRAFIFMASQTSSVVQEGWITSSK